MRRLAETPGVRLTFPPDVMMMPLTTQAREQYCRWATAAAQFYKGRKPIGFGGENWKL